MTKPVIAALVEVLLAHRSEIAREVRFAGQTWRDQIDHLRKLQAVEEAGGEVAAQSEDLWPFLLAAAFGSRSGGGATLTTRLVEDHERSTGPLVVGGRARATRELEGPTDLALAFGDLESHAGFLEPANVPRWLGGCECRFIADISTAATQAPHRNKLARTIEAACRLGAAPDCRIHVTLVSPHSFRSTRSRLYTERFQAYAASGGAILEDLAACRLPPRYAASELTDAVERLTLHWLSYDELFYDAPDTEVGRAIDAFRQRFDWTTSF